jgi:hypothetical protein
MLVFVLNAALLWSSLGASFVAPGMTYAQVAALVREQPVILNRSGGNIVRGIEYPKARLHVTFEEGVAVAVTRY